MVEQKKIVFDQVSEILLLSYLTFYSMVGPVVYTRGALFLFKVSAPFFRDQSLKANENKSSYCLNSALSPNFLAGSTPG